MRKQNNQGRGIYVEVKDGNIAVALRKFKKKVLESGLLRDLKEREHYEKPTTARKKAKASAKNRWRKKLQAELLPKKMY